MPEVKTIHTSGFSFEHKDYGYEIGYYSEKIDGELLDTEVCLDPDNSNGVHICTIAGKDILEFDKEFTALINKYRI